MTYTRSRRMDKFVKVLRGEALKNGIVVDRARLHIYGELRVEYLKPKTGRRHTIFYSQDLHNATENKIAKLAKNAALAL